MKKLLPLIILTIGLTCHAQVTLLDALLNDTIGYAVYEQPNDSLLAICNERGHVKSESCISTLMYCEPYVVDTDSTSTIVYPPCNWITYTCLRCGATFSEKEKEQRVVVWRKPKDITMIRDSNIIYPIMVYDTIIVDGPFDNFLYKK